jgi:hypothetical protein
MVDFLLKAAIYVVALSTHARAFSGAWLCSSSSSSSKASSCSCGFREQPPFASEGTLHPFNIRRRTACSLKAEGASSSNALPGPGLALVEFDVVEFWAADGCSDSGRGGAGSSSGAIVTSSRALHLGVILRSGNIQPLCCWQVQAS